MTHILPTLPTMIGRACTKAVFLDAFSSKNAMGRYGFNHSLSFDCGNNERFTFTGKGPRKGWRTPLNTIICSEQRDAETGLSYFGARYYDSDLLTGWLTVDPMSDKYPSMSSYSYCASNPLKLVDPDGQDFDPAMQTLVSELVIYCNRKIDRLQALGSRNDKENDLLKGYIETLSELEELENDHQTLYQFKSHANEEKYLGFITYGGEDDGRNIILVTIRNDLFSEEGHISMKGLGALAHELKHAYQFYSGDDGFAVKQEGDTQMIVAYNSKEFEIEAYDRGALFNGLNAQQKQDLAPEVFEINYGSFADFVSRYSTEGYRIIKHK